MIVFRQRDAGNSHVISACKAALEIAAEFPQSDCPLRTVSGIASGEAVSGKIGSKDGKLDHTVIGNPVNLAARLKNQAHIADQTGILLCPHTIRMLKGIGKLRFIERVEIKGRTRTFPMYELLALRTQ
jgi:class 3 adenylate cyclase